MKKAELLVFAFFLPFIGFSQNPIIQTIYTADPAPMVYNDTVYLYTTHDEDITVNNFFTMNDWRCFSSTDMVNWTDHGMILSYKDFSWASGDAWAGQCICRNGKFYFYVPVTQKSGGNAIGVAISDSPTGSFSDALGSPLLSGHGYIDPTVFIDNDGQAYLYWGNPNLYYVKLNDDMISYDEMVGIVQVPLTVESFGPRENTEERATSYEEGPWLYKRYNLYYLLYPAGGIPEHIAYSTSINPTGLWVYQDTIMHVFSKGAFTNHPGLIDYKGKSYFFYHSGALPGGGGFKRSVCAEEFEFNPEGTIPVITPTQAGIVESADNINPYLLTEAETIGWEEGIETFKDTVSGEIYVTDIENRDYIKVRGIDYGTTGAGTFTTRVSSETRASASFGSEIEIRLDEVNGTLIGSVPVSYTGGTDVWKTETIASDNVTGVHDIFFVFTGEDTERLFNFDNWHFNEKSSAHELFAINASVDNYKIDTIAGYNTSVITVTAIYTDGISEDITSETTFTFDQENIVSITDSIIRGANYGEVTATASYGGKQDETKLIVKNLESELAVKQLFADNDSVQLLTGGSYSIEISAEFYDGHIEIVTDKATFDNPDPDVAAITDGVVHAINEGEVDITVSYQGEMGESKSTIINIKVSNRSPYARNEAEDYTEQSGIQTEATGDAGGGLNVGFIENGDWLMFRSLDFGAGAISFKARVSSATSGGNIELHIDSLNGELIGTCIVTGTGGWQNWQTKSCDVSGAKGLHDLYLVFTGSGGYLFNINWWQYSDELTAIKDNFQEEVPVNVIYSNSTKYLKGTLPGDIIKIYNSLGQMIQSFLADSDLVQLNAVEGFVIIEVRRGQEHHVIKSII
jgi:arabinoxylan arabinofuranohydrolase